MYSADGQVFQKHLENINHEFSIKAKKEIKDERKWFTKISENKVPCPNGLSVQGNVEYVKNAISFLQNDAVYDGRLFHTLPFESVRGIVNNQYITVYNSI